MIGRGVELINASGWRLIASERETIYCAGAYSSDRVWRDNHRPFACVAKPNDGGPIQAWRDHFGQEPFYYACESGRFIFGSTLPDVIARRDRETLPNRKQFAAECVTRGRYGEAEYSSETFHRGIYRLEPGHVATVTDNSVKSSPFWSIDPNAPRIVYPNDDDYVAHFEALLNEAVRACIGDNPAPSSLAAEFSGGLDSSAIVVACHNIGVDPSLYSHVAPPDSEESDDFDLAQAVVNHLGLSPICRVDAERFDLLDVLDSCAERFAGAAPYVFFALANNVHRAVSNDRMTVLLSGFGGDQCVSGHAPPSAFYPDLLRQRKFGEAYREMRLQSARTGSPSSSAHVLTRLALYSNDPLFLLWRQASQAKRWVGEKMNRPSQSHWIRRRYRSVEHLECGLLQGAQSHETRMRIEFSAVAAKAFGFRYEYPLLHPKLVEFYNRLPTEQKRRNGIARRLIRAYLRRYLPEEVAAKEKKGGGILPATVHKAMQLYRAGALDSAFRGTGFDEEIAEIQEEKLRLFAKMAVYMTERYEAAQSKARALTLA